MPMIKPSGRRILSDDNSRFPPNDKVTCPQAMMGLSYNWSAMNSLVDSLSPTAAPISRSAWCGAGSRWSVAGRSPRRPWNSDYHYSRCIILLSDGLNTQDRWYGDGSQYQHRGRRTHVRLQRQRHLRQHQRGRHHALYHPGQHRRRPDLDAAAELRGHRTPYGKEIPDPNKFSC